MIETTPYVVSVVRDFDMYKKCIGENRFFDNFRKIVFNNNETNQTVSHRYNSFLNRLSPDDDCWIAFCHEDWMPEENMAQILDNLDKSRIYGPIGVFLQHRLFKDYIIPSGSIKMCMKDGSKLIRIGKHSLKQGRVDTLDCQCMIIHTELVRRYNLRFDENLHFDMYVEDFCASAHSKYGIITEVYPIKCCHFSYGVLGKSFYEALDYMKKKYSKSYKGYVSTAGDKSNFGYRQYGRIHHSHFPRLAMRLNGKIFKRNK